MKVSRGWATYGMLARRRANRGAARGPGAGRGANAETGRVRRQPHRRLRREARPGFPEVLEAALKAKGIDVSVVNAGVSGETAEDGLARFDWSVPPDTDALIVELGANDMLRGHAGRRGEGARWPQFSPRRAQRRIADPADRHEGRAQLRARLPRRVRRDLSRSGQAYGVALYPFFLDGVAAIPKLNQQDGLHPNPKASRSSSRGFCRRWRRC